MRFFQILFLAISIITLPIGKTKLVYAAKDKLTVKGKNIMVLPEREILEQLIEDNADKIDDPEFELDKHAFLKALAMCESSFGKNKVKRFEKAYHINGSYYKKDPRVRELVGTFGMDASCAFSSFQILFVTACHLGFSGYPVELNKDEVAIEYVIKYINDRIIARNPKKVEDLFDAYNSGNFNDTKIPKGYISKGIYWYNRYNEIGE